MQELRAESHKRGAERQQPGATSPEERKSIRSYGTRKTTWGLADGVYEHLSYHAVRPKSLNIPNFRDRCTSINIDENRAESVTIDEYQLKPMTTNVNQ